MPLGINSNIPAFRNANQLNQTNNNLNRGFERTSSGKRINSAADDAAGIAIATRLTAQIFGSQTASRNALDAISLTQTAEGGLGGVTENLQRIRELSLQAVNGSLSSSDRGALQKEVNQLTQEITRTTETTTFNGVPVLDTDLNLEFQVGANAGDTIAVSNNNIGQNLQNFGVNGIDISTVDGANAAISVVDQALEAVNQTRSEFGAIQNRFESTIRTEETNRINTAASRSRIEDADFAKEIAEQTKNLILQQAGIAVQAQVNNLPKSILTLINN